MCIRDRGWGVDAFVEDWKGVEETQHQGTLDGSIVAQAVILYMKDKDRVELSAAKLHAALVVRAEDELALKDDKTWPKTGRTLWKKIREVTPLLETHGIRAYRKNDNRAGRPIVLDRGFDDDGSDDNYAKNTDDNADDNRYADDNADDNFRASSADTPHGNGISDDNGDDGRYFGVSLGSHALIKKERDRQGESNTDLSSASSVSSEPSTGTWKNHKALEALRAPKLAPMVQQFFDGKAGRDALAGAVAAFHRDGGRWEDWREPTVRALTVLEETR